MPTKGIKRKFHDWEESVLDGHLSFQTDRYSFFRQSLLNMSLEKFNQGRMMIEPSLRRYVLIANTLRVIQEEIHHENPCTVPNFEEIVPSICDPLSGNVASSAFPPDLENIILPSMEDDLSVNTAIASILKELESTLDESCPQNPQPHLDIQDLESKRESSNNLGSTFPLSVKPPCDQDATVKEEVFNSNPDDDNRDLELIRELMLAASCSDNPEPMDTLVMEQVPTVPSNVSEVPVALNDTSTQEISSQTSTMQNIPSVHPEELRVLEPVFGNFEIMNSSYLNDVSFDDPFSDIDTSVFEKETLIPGTTQSSRLSSEELWFTSFCNSPPYSSGQGLREPNDLDNIVEILVGS